MSFTAFKTFFVQTKTMAQKHIDATRHGFLLCTNIMEEIHVRLKVLHTFQTKRYDGGSGYNKCRREKIFLSYIKRIKTYCVFIAQL
jgi:hypothetical protein